MAFFLAGCLLVAVRSPPLLLLAGSGVRRTPVVLLQQRDGSRRAKDLQKKAVVPALEKDRHLYFDRVELTLQGGDGGNGAVVQGAQASDRSALEMPAGGPGGDVVLFVDTSVSDLLHLRVCCAAAVAGARCKRPARGEDRRSGAGLANRLQAVHSRRRSLSTLSPVPLRVRPDLARPTVVTGSPEAQGRGWARLSRPAVAARGREAAAPRRERPRGRQPAARSDGRDPARGRAPGHLRQDGGGQGAGPAG